MSNGVQRITPEMVRGQALAHRHQGSHASASLWDALADQMEADSQLIGALKQDLLIRAKDASEYAFGLRQHIDKDEERIFALVAEVEQLRTENKACHQRIEVVRQMKPIRTGEDPQGKQWWDGYEAAVGFAVMILSGATQAAALRGEPPESEEKG